MKEDKKDYGLEMFDKISEVLDGIGAGDESYTDEDRALDILNVLETHLAFTIYSTCISKETINESAKESYDNIKSRALEMLKDNPIEE